jgi:DNA-binding transcriptional LysR family regulator
MSLSVKDIEYFLAVVQRGALSGAAEDMGVTQPTLTKAIQRVEAEFGVALFVRSGRGMALTSAGLRAAEQLQRLNAAHADTQILANDMRAQQAGLLRIGVTDASGESPVADAITSLLTQRPGMRIRLQHGRSDALAAQVMAAELDAAIVPAYEGQPLPGERTKISSDPMQLVVRRSHPLAQQSRVSVKDLVPYGWVIGSTSSAAYRAIEAVFAERNLPPPRVVLEVPYTSALSAGVLARSHLVSLLPASFLRRTDGASFVVLPVPEFRLARSVVLVTRSGSSASPLLSALRDSLLRHIKTPKP